MNRRRLDRRVNANEVRQTPADTGGEPFVGNLYELTLKNPNYRAALWTGGDLQLTVMSIPAGGDIGLEVHDELDQLLYIVSGHGIVRMGVAENDLGLRKPVSEGFSVIIPRGTWHNVINSGREPIKLFSVYAPPNHPKGTVQPTKADAEKSEAN